jgi:hypothetical protein
MNSEEWKSEWQTFLQLWPKWEPKAAEQSIWRAALIGFSLQALEHARIDHYKASKLHKPNLEAVERFAKKHWSTYQQKAQKGSLEDFAWICERKDENGNGPVGHVFQFTDVAPSLDQINYQSRRCHWGYGGHWIFVCGFREIRRKRREILGEPASPKK